MSAVRCSLAEIDRMIATIESEWPGLATHEREAVDQLRFLLSQVRITIGSPTYANLEHLREMLDKFEGRTP